MTNKVSNNRGTPGANPGGSSFVGDIPTLNVYDPISQKPRPAWAVAAVDELLSKIRHKNIWEVVDFCIEIWAKRFPEDHKTFFKELKEYRKQRDNEFAATKSKAWREMVVIPPLVWYLLQKIAYEKIRDYGEDKFKRDFSKRYAGFRPGEKY